MMKNLFTALSWIFCLSIWGQSPLGAWQAQSQDPELGALHVVSIVSSSHQVITWYRQENGAFVRTMGGSWELMDDRWTLTVEFDSTQSDLVGSTQEYTVTPTATGYYMAPLGLHFSQIDAGTPGALAGAWLMTGRKQDGQISTRSTDGPRKTMKILSGTRFQWIAYNTETKSFMGSGGGTYTTENGQYTEHIEFFSRDQTRVGATLPFDFTLVDGAWHHSGMSSQGAPIYEVWTQRY
jgi:hypothetical protein